MNIGIGINLAAARAAFAAAGPAYLLHDTFTGDGLLSAHTAETGQTWTIEPGFGNPPVVDPTIASGQLAIYEKWCSADVGTANVDITVTFVDISGYAALLVRYTDYMSDLLQLQAEGPYVLYEHTNEVTTEIARGTASPANGDVIRFIANGASVSWTVNGVADGSGTTTLLTGNRACLAQFDYPPTAIFDAIAVTAPA